MDLGDIVDRPGLYTKVEATPKGLKNISTRTDLGNKNIQLLRAL